MRSLAAWIEGHQTFCRDKIAIRFNREQISYGQFASRIARLSAWLVDEQRLAPGSRIAWLGYNHPDLLALLFACANCSVVLVPLNWRLSAPELTAVLEDAGATLVLVDRHCAATGDKLGRPSISLDTLPQTTDEVELLASNCAPDTPLLLVYTSGTTGQAKGAVLSQSAVLFNALNAIHMHAMTAADKVLTVLPLFHVGGLNIQTLPALYCGAELVLEPRFEPGATLAQIAQQKPSLTTLVPATIAAIVADDDWPTTDIGSLRAVATGSTDVPREHIQAIHQRGVPVIQIYGATETGPVAIYQRIEDAERSVGSIGCKGLHTEIRLVDASGVEVEDGERGEIWVRGPHVASGYWQKTGGRIEPFKQGWFASGDVAERDQDGFYWFADRLKHVIISGGENIYPAELERVLNRSSRIKEAAVVGRAHARWGEVPVVVAVKADPACDSAEVLSMFDGELARYKHPHAVLFVEQIPRTALGKVAVAEVRALVEALAES